MKRKNSNTHAHVLQRMLDGQLYGGITYIARISGGLAQDETCQVSAVHFAAAESVIMFVRVVS